MMVRATLITATALLLALQSRVEAQGACPPLVRRDDPRTVYLSCQTASPATIRVTSPTFYPSPMLQAGVGGNVTLQFIVERDASIDTTSFKTFKSPHDLFTAAARQMIINGRVQSARADDHAVRQLVTHTVVFEPADSSVHCRRSLARLDTTFVCAKHR